MDMTTAFIVLLLMVAEITLTVSVSSMLT